MALELTAIRQEPQDKAYDKAEDEAERPGYEDTEQRPLVRFRREDDRADETAEEPDDAQYRAPFKHRFPQSPADPLQQIPDREPSPDVSVASHNEILEIVMLRGALLWLIGIPLPIILILWLLGYLH
ncbi:MAG: hypothetical protein E5X49_10925 [Mesorhizobium sp.]|uniref:hypothetical protein n=1 Tax=Mesorhizobium sp. TaxID=1871066 RepID=UPI0011F73EFB|nr:hypothetical protein [Mesorhizobium sp.]TIQ43572.1 MAG: hypothetical protein E5X49_10925 [Mesorhizobium sp.]